MDPKPNAATPAPAAPPANVAPGNTQPSNSATPKPEGTVTIPTAEFAKLQRAAARSLSFDNRVKARDSRNNPTRETNNPNATPEQIALADEQARADAAERRTMQLEVSNSVRDILAKPEYANIPKSTRDLILKNPQMLSDADNVEDALLDIEDRLTEIAQDADNGDGIPVTVKNDGAPSRPGPAATHETPPTGASGAATPTGGEMEDTSKLTGSARSRAILRNSIRTKKAGA